MYFAAKLCCFSYFIGGTAVPYIVPLFTINGFGTVTDVCFPLKAKEPARVGGCLYYLAPPVVPVPSRPVGYFVAGRQLRSWIYNII